MNVASSIVAISVLAVSPARMALTIPVSLIVICLAPSGMVIAGRRG
jgi:hypothetical protein